MAIHSNCLRPAAHLRSKGKRHMNQQECSQVFFALFAVVLGELRGKGFVAA
jgi:hypothetical protein